ncbi:hypothetical protein [Streptomyces sulphureus]|nr:hypothetical protein [Streptomyces sulphureus]
MIRDLADIPTTQQAAEWHRIAVDLERALDALPPQRPLRPVTNTALEAA